MKNPQEWMKQMQGDNWQDAMPKEGDFNKSMGDFNSAMGNLDEAMAQIKDLSSALGGKGGVPDMEALSKLAGQFGAQGGQGGQFDFAKQFGGGF